MNTKQNTIKLFTCGIIALILVLMASCGLLIIKHPTSIVYATDENTLPINMSISNADFESDSYSTYPDTSFTGFEAAKTSENESSVKAGVIDLNDSEFVNKFANANRSEHNHVLMIESYISTEYGFKTKANNSIKIKPNSYYMVTVDVFTETGSNLGNLYLFNGDETISKITDINSIGWQTYTFFMSTNDLSSFDLTLGMYLNGNGAVLFDNLSAFQLNQAQYLSKMNNLKILGLPYKEYKNDSNITVQYKMSSGKFEKAEGNYNESFDSSTIKDSSNFIISTLPGKDDYNYTTSTFVQNSDSYNDTALLIQNYNPTFVQYSTQDDFLTFEQNNLYKVSLNVKTENVSGKATIQLVRTNAEEDDVSAKDSGVIEITTSETSENVTNNYTSYSFYVYGDPIKNTTYKLVFGLGNQDNLTTGKMYVNTLTVSRIDYETYKNAGSTYQLDLSSHYANANAATNNIPMLNNGEFNAMQVTDLFGNKPAAATDWNVQVGKGTQYHGIVNTADKYFNKLENLNTSNLKNPYGSANINNNLLMLYNESEDTLSYTSSTRSLEANSYHKFDISLLTQLPNPNKDTVTISLVTTLNNNEVELTKATVAANESQFEKYSIYIHTANQKLDVSLKITLNTSGYGYVYADDAMFDYFIAPTEEEFNNITASKYCSKVDLNNFLVENNNSLYYYTASTSDVVAKIIDLSDDAMVNQFAIDKEAFLATSANKVIAIRSAYDVNFTLTSKLGYSLSSGKYYKVSVDVYNQFIESANEDATSENTGAGITLEGADGNFSNINSNNEWTTYTFYISTSSAKTIYLKFNLGNAEINAKGDVFFGNITFEDVSEEYTEESFNSLTETSNIKVVKDSETPEEDAEEDTTTEETEKEPLSLSTILYLAAGSITGIALIIALIGIGIRKIKFKKPVKKSKNAYDRNKTVSKQVYMRKATTERENKILELKKDLQKITEERTKFEDEYKKDLTKLRELKLKRASAAEISKLEKEMKKNQKLSSSLGVTMNRIQAELDYVQTDAYLNSLMRKLEHESHSNLNSNNDKK